MGLGSLFKSDLLRPLNPDPDAHKLSDFNKNVDTLLGRNKTPGAPAPGPSAPKSYYPGGFPSTWGTLSPMPIVNPLSQAQWYTPNQLDSLMAFNGAMPGAQGPSGLALGSFMARLHSLYGGDSNGGT